MGRPLFAICLAFAPLISSALAQDLSKTLLHPSAMTSAYIARSSRPIAAVQHSLLQPRENGVGFNPELPAGRA